MSTRVRRPASSRLCRCGCNNDCDKTSQRTACSRSTSVTDPVSRRSSSCLRSSSRHIVVEGTAPKGSERELHDKGAEPANRGSMSNADHKGVDSVNKESTIAADHLPQQSSEGLRWLSKLGDEKAELRTPTRDSGDEGDKPTQNRSERELGNDQSEFEGLDNRPSYKDDSNLELITAGPEEPDSFTGSPLPPAPPSPISRQCLAVVCFCIVLIFLCMLVTILAYRRWTTKPTWATPIAGGDPGIAGHKLDMMDSDSACDSLFSFSRCSNADMFG